MHDQLRAAEAVGIRAATLTSVDTNQAETIARFRAGELDLLYVAPERASGERFPRPARPGAAQRCSRSTRRIACPNGGMISAPITACCARCSTRFRDVPRLALTATADAHTRADILDQLGIPHDGLIVAGFDRPNIRYLISPQRQYRRGRSPT